MIYVKFVAGLQQAGVQPHYAVHVTGHGLRKLMRLDEPFVYRVWDVRSLPIFEFLQRAGGIAEREMYATFNMGVGFAVYVAPADVDATLRVAREAGYDAWPAGTVHKQGTRKAVEISPLGITFDADTLQVR